MTPTCPRIRIFREACTHCGAQPREDCPLADIAPDLLTGKPVTAGRAAACDPADGVCEACE